MKNENHASPPALTPDQESRIFRAACRRVTAAVLGEPVESSRELLGDVADLPVFGAFVTLRRDGRLRACCGNVEASKPLVKSLDVAADRAATDDPRFPPIVTSELHHLHVDVWILWGPTPVEERGEDRVNAVVIGKHGLLVSRGHSRGLLLPSVAIEHGFDARTFLDQTCIKAGLPPDAWKDDGTEVLRFEGRAIEGMMLASEGGSTGEDARQPAVAGGFYPGTAGEVQEALDMLFACAAPPVPQPWAGALVPHAGWLYSGRLAAAVLSRVAMPDCVIVLCPKHRPGGATWAVAPHRRWLFPGGELASDPELAARLAAGVPGLELDSAAHRQEHAIEVQLPLLARVAPNVRVVGITVGDASLNELLAFGEAMSVVLREMPQRPFLLVSSDMNHFADDRHTRRVDRLALNAIATLDPEQVYNTIHRNGISMCGAAPCVVAMEALRRLGCLNRCEEVGYATSADAGGPTDRVVGYAGILFG